MDFAGKVVIDPELYGNCDLWGCRLTNSKMVFMALSETRLINKLLLSTGWGKTEANFRIFARI